ncbi:unnamed protein product [Clonostachys rosea]|uniref:histidine kinase n=1 Tax=Bionectria ochroleuca TaxID=29856 RepID=A0ABY6U8Z9_BIOOC|nr:unnamed protein product [Clonostachys rosea]
MPGPDVSSVDQRASPVATRQQNPPSSLSPIDPGTTNPDDSTFGEAQGDGILEALSEPLTGQGHGAMDADDNTAQEPPLSSEAPTKDMATLSDSGLGRGGVLLERIHYAGAAARVGSPTQTASQKQLNEYREKLARDLERRELSARGLLVSPVEKARVSPIQEELAMSLPQLTSSSTATASTESNNTVRGGMTPAMSASTPSYPFPRMAGGAFNLYKSFGASSPEAPFRPSYTPNFDPSMGAQDRVLSNTSTPASTYTFHPSGSQQKTEDMDFPSPNLYDLSLMLSAEPGLDAWWNTVVQIMKDVYKAERVTLAVPADSTDIENVPWGQKATYNEHQEDDLSLGYMARGSSAVHSTGFDPQDPSTGREEQPRTATPRRPEFRSRHSYTSYEESKENSPERSAGSSQRPSVLRSKSYLSRSDVPPQEPGEDTKLNKHALHEHDLLEEQRALPPWEAPFMAQDGNGGRVLPVLQALDYEADPLIDHSGVMRVLERGKVVALTRTYPYLEVNLPPDANPKPQIGQDTPKKYAKQRSDSAAKLTSMFGQSSSNRGPGRPRMTPGDKLKGVSTRFDDDEVPRPRTPKYEEFEQAPPSPWSQSPAPSPAVRPDPKENPFFTDATVDEDSFNPGITPQDYSGLPPPEAIGIDNSWTVLHIPLTHVLLSQSPRPFKLNSAALDQRSHDGRKDDTDANSKDSTCLSPDSHQKSRVAPIAILSILSPIIPYPSNLRHSLQHLAPHMANSFSLCRHYSNLETEITGLHRRRPSTAGFGAVAPNGRPLTSNVFLAGDFARQQSVPGSMTSPSDYSAVSKSITGSPAGTPGWDSSALSFLADKRPPVASPVATSLGGESYFGSIQQITSSRQDILGSGVNSRAPSKDNSPSEKRQSRILTTKPLQDLLDSAESLDRAGPDPEPASVTEGSDVPIKENQLDGITVSSEPPVDEQKSGSKVPHSHTMLHSYGADFASTFQSLPPSSSLLSKPPPTASAPPRGMSYTSAVVDMPPPSDRLKGLMLDSLPAHVFVALPQTGEIVWVNSRYLSYRGQTVADLAEDPWSSIHPDDCEEYLRAWSHSLRTGEQFSRTVRIKRFDGTYRWFYARAVASKDKRGVIMQFLGSYMDIHDQHIAELKAARQEEIEASEAKHRLLANLIPQIIFTATEEDGITFANEQWLSYTGQSFDDSLGLGFLDFVHPEDLAKCRIPTDTPPTPVRNRQEGKKDSNKVPPSPDAPSYKTVQPSKGGGHSKAQDSTDINLRGVHKALSRHNSSGNSSIYELPSADLTELARKGIIKVTTDSNGRLSYTTEVRLRSRSGEYRWHLIRCVEIGTMDSAGGASSYFGSATDINDHKLLEAKLKEAMEAKGRFLSNMSHEIRTPLIGISGMVSFLQDTVLNEEQRDYTNTIQTSANSLIMIINDILDLSKVDAGMMKLKFEWFHTRSLIEDVNELVSTMAIAKGLELNYLVEADVPAWVKGDKVRIRQVLLNVIGNAIKFTSEGEVFSRCKVYHQDDQSSDEEHIMLEYSIIDTGQGFTEKEAELIFKPFSQIDGSSTRQHGGSGLGLVISKQLVELHGGNMAGTAVPGKGSTFIFTACFGLPTAKDHPDLPGSPSSYSVTTRPSSSSGVPSNLPSLPPPKQESVLKTTSAVRGDLDSISPELGSNGSSNLSMESARSRHTDRSSATSINTGLVRFSEAAKASGQDLSQMKLEMPSGNSSPARTATPDNPNQGLLEEFRPPMYSILIICPQVYSREATTRHIEMTLPKDVPRQITGLGSAEEAQKLIGGEDPINFTHIVINLGSAGAVVDLLGQVTRSQKIDNTTILILSDSVQRQAVTKLAANTPFERLLTKNLVTFIYKPVKPSRFAVIFDPEKMRDVSIDRNRSTAQKMVESQKASYLEIEKRMGNKGYRVLLVEDNPVNQKVLMKYLKKIGVDVDIAVDGVECIEMVMSRPQRHYSLILCDLHMPRKDGYQACREIRQWEKEADAPSMPIIALSANVMSDVQDKCIAAGFSDYVTKPVDFIDLSRAMAKFF